MALPIFQRTVVDDEGNIVAGATVTVLLESTGLAANIYSDRAGAAALSNPFTTGSDGLARFYAAPGEYRIQVSGPSTSVDWRYQILGGTASTYDVTESTTDTSTGENGQPRVMRVGDGGRMTAGLRRSGTFNLDVLINEGVYFISPATDSVSGSLPFGGSTPFILEVIPASTSDSNVDSVNRRVVQRAYRYDSSNTESYRASNALGFFYPWQEILHTGNTGSIVTEDYEEGTWTPSLLNGGTITPLQSSLYVKMGNTVNIQLYVSISSIPNDSNEFRISGLPFLGSGTFSAISIGYVGAQSQIWSGIVNSTGSPYIAFHVAGSTARRVNSDAISTGLTALILQATYQVA